MRIASSLLAVPVLFASASSLAQPVTLPWSLQTQPAVAGTNTIQDVAIWVHPRVPANSLLLTADTQNGLLTYGLDGGAQQLYAADGIVSSVDVHEGFPLGTTSQSLVVTANPSLNGLVAYVIDPTTLTLRRVSSVMDQAHGYNTVRLYRSPNTGSFFAFAGGQDGTLRQLQLQAVSDGGVEATPVRDFGNVGTGLAGAVADDLAGALYVTRAGQGIFRFAAEPDAGISGTRVVDPSLLSAQAGRLALYSASSTDGYLLVADTGASAFDVFDRRSLASLGSFRLDQDGGVDAVDAPRALAVYSGPLGSVFPEGLFVAHDAIHAPADNLKLVSWGAVARAFSPPLRIASQVPPADGGVPGDGGVGDGGVDGGSGGTTQPGGNGPVGGFPSVPHDDGNGCACGTTSVPGATLLALLAMAVWGRRRTRQS
ncbi:phytase [Corallococcus sp. M34]|uniref:myxosortase-dependent phytase-like phosphatase n=1 Tax=Citreicoccus inhibens TaxID=2849499 RepID=UPI001C21970D|nr:myxosortase-dependent phytase-like phosphatase [Citreicoccus inhibens]MBU8899872.1 phytase [Citreicoccus inhibens]